jgi:hypothetical protein
MTLYCILISLYNYEPDKVNTWKLLVLQFHVDKLQIVYKKNLIQGYVVINFYIKHIM